MTKEKSLLAPLLMESPTGVRANDNQLDTLQNNSNFSTTDALSSGRQEKLRTNKTTIRIQFSEYKILFLLFYVFGLVPVSRVYNSLSNSKVVAILLSAIYCLYSLFSLLCTGYPLIGFIYFLIVKIRVGQGYDPGRNEIVLLLLY